MLTTDASKNSTPFLSKEIAVYLVLTLCSVLTLIAFVNLIPQVDEDFFFSSSDPHFQQEKRISKSFKRKDTQLILAAQGKIETPEYAQKVDLLSQEIASVPGVVTVVSITRGPKDYLDALNSPFWKRLLISDDRQGTNIIVVLEKGKTETAVSSIEQLVKKTGTNDFAVLISGIPYIITLIQRQLVHDFSTFSLLAFILFSFVILFIFRSWRILLGTMVCCLDAAIWTLMITHLVHIPIGLLTANLATVVFVLTLSPIIFLTYNWQHLPNLKPDVDRVHQAIRYTITPSSWSTSTVLLGFLSLLTVPAKPLRELGISGAIGAFIAFGTAYLIYPIFLRKTSLPGDQTDFIGKCERGVYFKLKKMNNLIPLFIVGFGLIALPGLWMMNNDPSLFSYFKKDSEITKGLKYIDHNGGSNPLIIVVRDKSGAKLNTTEAYKKLWDLQIALENHESVGAVLSLPVLMAQAKKSPLAFFLSWEWLFDILETPKYDEISKSFVSDDRQDGVFLLRMKEYNRKLPRLEVFDQLKKIVETKGFIPDITGGTYLLQGYMSKQVTSSLVYGLLNLLLIFFVIDCLASGSLKVGFAMTVSFSVIPLTILGIVGIMKIPLDVISAPAINVAIGMGIDSALYTVRYWRWNKKNHGSDEENWEAAKMFMWNPVVNAMLVIILGFGIFLFSQFPPTQRFGATLISGAFLSIFVSIFFMPWLVGFSGRCFKKIGVQ